MTHSCIVRRCRKPFHGTSKGIGADEGEIGFDYGIFLGLIHLESLVPASLCPAFPIELPSS
jgi:hypothetical protein